MLTSRWTLDELVAQVASALAVDYGGQASGRVRDLPDRRAVRWYQTLGLVDRPADWRGRTALYGRRHLLQLTAIKRLQAAGHTLAEIQAELTGISDARLAQLAGAAGQGADDEAPASGAGAARAASARRFWAARSDGAAAWPEAGEAPEPDNGRPALGAAEWRGIQLGPAAILLLDAGRALDDDDLRDLRAAAAPLLAALRDHGLAPPERNDAP
jgi:DNA-binding transcriptional MerR regulator